MNTEVLSDLGMTKGQIRIYLALLELGETTSGPVIKKTKLQNSVVYNALNQLIEKGLVTFSLKGKIKQFNATNPNNLIKFVQDKKEKIEELVPMLHKRQREAKVKQEAQVFLGWKGIYNAFNLILELLPKGSEYIAYGAGFGDQYTEEAIQFFREFQKKRAAMKYKIRIIANEDAREQVNNYKFFTKFGKPEFRFVPGFVSIGVIIFGDHKLDIAFEETPVAILITSKKIAESHRKAFYAMWKIAKK